MRRMVMIMSFLLAVLHAYVGVRLLPALSSDLAVGIGAGLLVLSFLLIPLGLAARIVHQQPLSDRMAWVGLLTMGFFSSLLVLTLTRDVLLLAFGWIGAGHGQLVADSAVAVPMLALAMTLVGFLNARRRAQIVHVEVPIRNLPAELEGFTIAQVSDIHVGPTIKHAYLRAIVDAVNALDADVVAVTGDLVDGPVSQLAPHTAPLADLRARHGAYFVTGNHEYYSNAPEWITEVRRLGLRVLMNEHVVIRRAKSSLVLAGVTDYSAYQFDPAQRSDPQAALAGAPEDAAVRVLLAHQPRSANAAAAAGFDLQLSGHTHGGQFVPWNFFVPLQQPFVAGLHRLQDLWVYTSRGTGYWGPPKRLGAPAEITCLRLVAEVP